MRSVLPAVLVAALVSSCAHQKETQVHSRAARHIYEAPIDDVWPKVRRALMEEGFRLREDPQSYAIETEWTERFASSKIAGTWTRYLVLGDPLGPTRCKVRVFKSEKTANSTMEKAGAEISWAPRSDMGAQGAADPALLGGEPAPTDSIQTTSERLDTPDGQMRSLAPGASAMRDLEMEWTLVQRIEPQIADAIARGAPVARAADTSETVRVISSPSVPQVDCGSFIPGVNKLVRSGAVLLLGEVHGTREVPRFVADAACQAALAGTPVSVGLQIPTDESALVAAYLKSAGSEEDRAALIEGMFFLRPYQDGRSSAAMVQLLEEIRQLRLHGLDLIVFLYDTTRDHGQPREDAMAQVIEAEVRNHPERAFLVLSGNVHNRRAVGVRWDEKYTPMGLRLASKLEHVTALDMAYADGTAWICTMGSKLDCGVRPAKGRDNGPRRFIHLWDDPENGYDGIFYVGAVTASEPARGAGVTSKWLDDKEQK